MFKGSGLGLCPEIRTTGSSVQERCQAQTSLSWDFPVAYSPPACTEQKRPNTLRLQAKRESFLLGQGSRNRASFKGSSWRARLKLTEQNGKCVREGKAENGPNRSWGRSPSPLQPALPRNKAAPGLPRGSLARWLWDSPAKNSQREVEPGVGGVANTGRGGARRGGLSLSPQGAQGAGPGLVANPGPGAEALETIRGHAGEGKEAAAAQMRVLRFLSQRGLEKPRRAWTTVQLRTSLDILVPLQKALK